MLKINDPLAFAEQCLSWRKAGQSLSLFASMGSFHQGHELIMQAAKKKAQKLVVSLFLHPEPAQESNDPAFSHNSPELDIAIAEGNRVDVLFAPSKEQLFPHGYDTYVYVPKLFNLLRNKVTPHYFRNVCTVMLKLLILAQPDFAFFGQDNWQQLAVFRRMVCDLHLPLSVESVPTTREADGLPMNIRNQLLTPEERAVAPHFCKGVSIARQLFSAGETSIRILSGHILNYWAENIPQGKVEYLQFIDPLTLKLKKKADADTLIIVSMLLGKTKLVDNQLLSQ